MHDSVLVTVYHMTYILPIWINLSRAFKSVTELNAFFSSFLSLNAHNFFYWLSDVKSAGVLPKFACFDLAVVKKILDHVVHDLGCILLNFFTIIQLA